MLSDSGFSQLVTVRVSQEAPPPFAMDSALRWRLGVSAFFLLLFLVLSLLMPAGPFTYTLLLCSSLIPLAQMQNYRTYWQGRRQTARVQMVTAVMVTLGQLSALFTAWRGMGVGWVLICFVSAYWIEWLFLARTCPIGAGDMDGTKFWKKHISGDIRDALRFGLFLMTWYLYLRFDLFLVWINAEFALLPPFKEERGWRIRGMSEVICRRPGFLAGGCMRMAGRRRADIPLPRPHPLAGRPVSGGRNYRRLRGAFRRAGAFGPAGAPSVFGSATEITRTLLVSGFFHAAALICGNIAIGLKMPRSRYLWMMQPVGHAGDAGYRRFCRRISWPRPPSPGAG